MGIGAAKAERAESGDPPPVHGLPGGPLGRYPDRQFGPGYERVWSAEVQVGGISPCCKAKTTFNRPAIPAAASRWPRLVFTEPIMSGRSAGRFAPRTAARAWTSIGSPSRVPVPWAST